MSDFKKQTSRENGAKSQGPVTPEGKARSSQNAIRHGFTAKTVVLSNESLEDFSQLVTDYRLDLKPLGRVENDLVMEVCVNRWRLVRTWTNETAVLDLQMDRDDPEMKKRFDVFDDATRLAVAWGKQADASKSLSLIHRYETRYRRGYERAMADLKRLQAERKSTQAAENKQLEAQTENLPNEPEKAPSKPVERPKMEWELPLDYPELDRWVRPVTPEAPSSPPKPLPEAA